MESKNIEKYRTITILIVANEEFSIRLAESFKVCSENTSEAYVLSLIVCENIEEVLQMSGNIPADYVVFVMDTRLKTCVKNVEYNIQLLNKELICGRTCIVNGNAHISHVDMAVSLNDINALKYKYSCTLLNADILDPNLCLHLAKRIITLIQLSLGLKQTIPFLPWISNDHNVANYE